jgi:hypothetical protein
VTLTVKNFKVQEGNKNNKSGFCALYSPSNLEGSDGKERRIDAKHNKQMVKT